MTSKGLAFLKKQLWQIEQSRDLVKISLDDEKMSDQSRGHLSEAHDLLEKVSRNLKLRIDTVENPKFSPHDINEFLSLECFEK